MYLQSSIFCVHCSVLLWIFCFVLWNRWSQLSIILHSLVRSSKSTVCTLVEHMFSEVSCFDLNEGVGFQPVPELFASSVVFVDIGYLFLLWLYCLLLLNVFTSGHNLEIKSHIVVVETSVGNVKESTGWWWWWSRWAWADSFWPITIWSWELQRCCYQWQRWRQRQWKNIWSVWLLALLTAGCFTAGFLMHRKAMINIDTLILFAEFMLCWKLSRTGYVS